MLVLALLEGGDMYGYQMIEELARRSNDLFQMKEGTLYPILHGLEKDKCLSSYQREAPTGRTRKYYRLTKKGKKLFGMANELTGYPVNYEVIRKNNPRIDTCEKENVKRALFSKIFTNRKLNEACIRTRGIRKSLRNFCKDEARKHCFCYLKYRIKIRRMT